MNTEIVYATDTAQVVLSSGVPVIVRKGEHWPANDEVVQRQPSLFSTDPRYGLRYTSEPAGFTDPAAEQATAAPGERRSARRG